MKILFLSTFDIHPINDGGRVRYNAIARHLAAYHNVTLLAYHLDDNLATKKYRLSDAFDVVSVPSSYEDWASCWEEYSKTKRIAHDVLCISRYSFNDEFKREAAQKISGADVVVVAHPYLVFFAKLYAKSDAILVYESHNVEFDAKKSHFTGVESDTKRGYLRDVFYAEALACRASHYVTAVSSTDADRLAELYVIDRKRIVVLPNGVDIKSYPKFTLEDKAMFKAHLGIDNIKDLAVFVGSGYGPNVSAYKKARALLSDAGFTGAVILVGSIAKADRSEWDDVPFREIWLGFVEEDLRIAAVGCADFALQFMFEGAGTNLKLFDYMAARTLIVGNSFGVRGVQGVDWFVKAENADEMRRVLVERPWSSVSGLILTEKARHIVEQTFDWHLIASQYNSMLMGDLTLL